MLHFYRSWDGWTNIVRYIKVKESWQAAVPHKSWLISNKSKQSWTWLLFGLEIPRKPSLQTDWDVVQALQMQSPFYSFELNSREPAKIVIFFYLDWTAKGLYGIFHMTDKSIYAHSCLEVLLLGVFPGLNVSIQSISFLLTMLALS